MSMVYNVPFCETIHVQPATTDDWEILVSIFTNTSLLLKSRDFLALNFTFFFLNLAFCATCVEFRGVRNGFFHFGSVRFGFLKSRTVRFGIRFGSDSLNIRFSDRFGFCLCKMSLLCVLNVVISTTTSSTPGNFCLNDR